MFKFRKQANSQAKRNAKVEPVTSLRWRKSWNWGFLLVPIIFAASYLAEAEQILPIRSIQLQGNFANLEQRQVDRWIRPDHLCGQFATILQTDHDAVGSEERRLDVTRAVTVKQLCQFSIVQIKTFAQRSGILFKQVFSSCLCWQ